MTDYSFLTGLTLVDTNRLREPKSNLPTGLTLRIKANGNVYPSKELVEKFDLEYKTKQAVGEGIPGNGIDVIDSEEWTPLTGHPRMIVLGFTPKTEAKVDIFGTCRYNDDGTPKASVLTQGVSCDTLLDLVRSMGYMTDDQKYCDLEVAIEYPITAADGITNIPKITERGHYKGRKTYERRENVTYFPVNTPENLKEIREQAKTKSTVVPTETVNNQTI